MCPVHRSDYKYNIVIIRKLFYLGKHASIEVSSILERIRICFKEFVLHKIRSLSFFSLYLCNFPFLLLLFFFSISNCTSLTFISVAVYYTVTKYLVVKKYITFQICFIIIIFILTLLNFLKILNVIS